MDRQVTAMTISQEPLVLAEDHGHAAQVQCGSGVLLKATRHAIEVGEVPLTLSRSSTCETLSRRVDITDMEGKIQYLEFEAKQARKREHDLWQQIYEAKAHILDKEK